MLLPTRVAVDRSSLSGPERYFALFPTVGTGGLVHRARPIVVTVSHFPHFAPTGCTTVRPFAGKLMYAGDTYAGRI